MENNTIININHVSKIYKLGQIGGASLQQELKSWWYTKHGREDPNQKINADTKVYGKEFYALKNINLQVQKGEVIGILGKNGAGKSTLLKLISRITAPSEGYIELNGRVASMLEVGTGFHQEMTGRENVYLNGSILGMSKNEITEKMDKIIEFSEVGDFIDTPVKRYSSGMYVKLAFAVAAHLDSEIMIMDEVLAVGDVAFQKKCIDKMREEAKNSGKTILYVSHNMNTIRQLCQKCIVLQQGEMIYNGTVDGGIKKYIGSKFELEKKKDFTDYRRPDWVPATQEITDIEIETETPVYRWDEIVKVRIHCKSKQAMKNLYVRYQIVSEDLNRIASVFTDKPFHTMENEEYYLNVQFSPKNLSSGQYRIKMVIAMRDENGNDFVVDWIDDAFSIEVKGKDDVVWQPTSWGEIRLDDMNIVKE